MNGNLQQPPPEKTAIVDWFVFVALVGGFFYLTWLRLPGGNHEYSELTLAAWVGTLALMLKFGNDRLGKYRGKILGEIFLTVGAGAIASIFVLLLALPKQKSNVRTEKYDVTWTFFNSSRPGMLKMQYTQLSHRIGRSGDPFWSKTFFEPYLWANGMAKFEVQCAANKAAFDESSPVGGVIKLPVSNRGFYLELDTADPSHRQAICTTDGNKMWVRIQATVDVPETYWDVAVGLVKLGNPPEFRMEDRTTNQNLAFVMAGPNDQFTHNVGSDNKLTRHELPLDPTGVTENAVRCQVYWYPVETLSTNSHLLITNRFRYVPK
jgi:uncharacterized membrane protein